MRLDAEVISSAEAIRGGFEHPVGVAADQVEQLTADHRDFCRVDTVRAID
jgi:hypothetical protein